MHSKVWLTPTFVLSTKVRRTPKCGKEKPLTFSKRSHLHRRTCRKPVTRFSQPYSDSCDLPFRTQDITPLVAGTHADVVPALLHLLQVFARLALKNQTTHIKASNSRTPSHSTTANIFWKKYSQPPAPLQPSTPEKTSSYTCIALEAVLEVSTPTRVSLLSPRSISATETLFLIALQALPSAASTPHLPALITRFYALLDPASKIRRHACCHAARDSCSRPAQSLALIADTFSTVSYLFAPSPPPLR